MSSNMRLIQFLQHELAVSPAEIEMLLRHPEQAHAPLPMLLWQYGLITVHQLTQIFDWLETE
jgi:ureidoglycolate hydrolase